MAGYYYSGLGLHGGWAVGDKHYYGSTTEVTLPEVLGMHVMYVVPSYGVAFEHVKTANTANGPISLRIKRQTVDLYLRWPTMSP